MLAGNTSTKNTAVRAAAVRRVEWASDADRETQLAGAAHVGPEASRPRQHVGDDRVEAARRREVRDSGEGQQSGQAQRQSVTKGHSRLPAATRLAAATTIQTSPTVRPARCQNPCAGPNVLATRAAAEVRPVQTDIRAQSACPARGTVECVAQRIAERGQGDPVDDEPGRHRGASRRVDRGELADVVSERGVAGRRPSAPGPRPDERRRSGDTAEREHAGGRFHTVDCTDRHDRLDRPRATTAIPSTPASSTTVTRSVTTPGLSRP